MQSIEPPLYSHPITTEYRKQFAWKEPIKREQRYVIPVSDINMDDEAKAGLEKKIVKYKPFKTEYQLQFKKYPLQKEPEAANLSSQKENEEFEKQSEYLSIFDRKQ